MTFPLGDPDILLEGDEEEEEEEENSGDSPTRGLYTMHIWIVTYYKLWPNYACTMDMSSSKIVEPNWE